MVLPRFDLLEPRSLDEALNIMAAGTAGTAVLAGGTDLLVAMKKGLKNPNLVVSLQRIPGLDGIREANDHIVIGPLVTMSQLCRSALIRDRLPALADGAAAVAAPLIRNRATLGGNLCNARPCADTAPPLMALGAVVVLSGPSGTRKVALEDLMTGPGETVLAVDELLTAVEIPLPRGASGSSYFKMIKRQALEITIVGVASQVRLEQSGGKVLDARIFASSVAPTPLMLSRTAAGVVGRSLDSATLEAAGAAASKEVRPIDDLRGEAWYRRHVSGVLTRRSLAEAGRRAGEVRR